MDDIAYNDWRRDIAAEYIARTGRAFPSMDTERGKQLRALLVAMSDRDDVPDPIEAVNECIRAGLLKDWTPCS